MPRYSRVCEDTRKEIIKLTREIHINVQKVYQRNRTKAKNDINIYIDKANLLIKKRYDMVMALYSRKNMNKGDKLHHIPNFKHFERFEGLER